MKAEQILNGFNLLHSMVKIKGDAGEYHVFGIDLFNWKLYVERHCGLEWVGFDKIQKIWDWRKL